MSKTDAIKDFSKAQYTAVVSDLHLCEEEPVNKRFPLWKKYKTKQFFFDEEFCLFLDEIQARARGEAVELILNGDIFDFDSVTTLPEDPPFRVSWLETKRGLHPQREKSVFKMEVILSAHKVWIEGVRKFLQNGNRVIFTIGNHDLELHFPRVQQKIIETLQLEDQQKSNVRFVEWFYISNGDTLIEHGNQYDPYCMAQDPVSPFVQRFNRVEIRAPFGNLATRYLINGMGFFNPHLDANFIMTPKQYVKFFLKYISRAQPFLIITWFWGSVVALVQSFMDRLRPTITDPLTIEDRVELVAKKANATPRMVRELKELFVAPAASYPGIIMRELWLDRAFMVLMTILLLYLFFLQIDHIFNISIFWVFIPVFIFIPFFLFYARSIASDVHAFKEPKEKILHTAGLITKTGRIVYGHTHIVRHEMIGVIEHLNSGTWSPAFLDVECKHPIGQKTFVWIYPGESEGARDAKVFQIRKGVVTEVFPAPGQRQEA